MPDFGASITRVCRLLPYNFAFPNGYRRIMLLLVIALLLAQSASSPLPNVATHSGTESTKLYAKGRTFNVQVAAATCAAISMATSFIAFYWFCRMEKRFRHRLIMLLIFGDLMKATWLFLFAAVSIARGSVDTKTAFCQSSGFLLQYGFETSDYAVLVIAVHSAIQVFRPSSQLRSDGLYPYRYLVYFGAVAIPTTMSGLAFINPVSGYMSLGTFCYLPLRPFWYRLALTWIPRYIIAIIILGLAVAIYTHVGFEFRSLSNMEQSAKPSVSTAAPTIPGNEMAESAGTMPESPELPINFNRRGSSVVSMFGASRRTSAVASLRSVPESAKDATKDADRLRSIPHSSHDILSSAADPISRTATRSTMRLGNAPSRAPSPHDSDDNTSPLSHCPTAHVQHQLAQQRARIHRQLRLMFIYPLVYIIMWVIPFVNHCMTYNDEWAAHPVYWIYLLNTIAVALMSTVDCAIFSIRERPWRHIPSSDGSFWGSFAWWRKLPTNANGGPIRPTGGLHRAQTEATPDTPNVSGVTQEPGWKYSVARVGRSVRTSGSSDHAKHEAEMARMRLEFEKEDRRAAFKMREDEMQEKRGRNLRRSTELETIESPGDEIEGFKISNGEDKSSKASNVESAQEERAGKKKEKSDCGSGGITTEKHGKRDL